MTSYYHTTMAKRVVTFKLEEHIYSKLKQLASDEGRTPSEILREALNAYLEKKPGRALPDFIEFIRKQKAEGKSWTGISALVQARYRVSLTKDQLKALTDKP
jgi:predicted transcriptional regulator